MIIATPSGGIKGVGGHEGLFSQSEALPPLTPCQRGKKKAKISYFWQIFGFLPLRITFCPLDARPPPPKKNLVPPLATPSGGLIES